MLREIQPPAEENPKPVAHIYAFAIAWVVVASVLPIVDIYDFIATVVVSGMITLPVFVIAKVVYHMRGGRNSTRNTAQHAPMSSPRPYREPPVAAPSSISNNEVESLTNEAMASLKKMEAAKNKIFNGEVVGNTNEIIGTSCKIIEKVRRNPEVLQSANSFFTYYLPKTVKLVENYYHMESQNIGSGNIASTMQKIEETLQTLKNVYKEQLDVLFSDTASELASDINVLESYLKLDGFVELAEMESVQKTRGGYTRMN